MPIRGFEKAKEWISRFDRRRDAARDAAHVMASFRTIETLGEIAAPGNEPDNDPLECGVEDVSAALAQLNGLVHDLTSMAECAARMARNNASQINQSVGTADNAVTAVEALAREVSADKEFLQVAAMDAVRLSFNTTVQMVGARSSAKRLAETLQGVLELAREAQDFAAVLRERIDAGGVGDEAAGKIRCCG